MRGQELSCGATLLDAMHPLGIQTYAGFFTGSRPSPILRNDPFPFALESPFGLVYRSAIAPSAALCAGIRKTYLLFLIGFPYYTISKRICQYISAIFYFFFFILTAIYTTAAVTAAAIMMIMTVVFALSFFRRPTVFCRFTGLSDCLGVFYFFPFCFHLV